MGKQGYATLNVTVQKLTNTLIFDRGSMEKLHTPMHGSQPWNKHDDPKSRFEKIITASTFQTFFNTLSNGGFLLFMSAVLALVWSNINPEGYGHFWHKELTISLGKGGISHSLAHWVNDALMTFFFFTVGLEIKREMLVGGLSDMRKASLPVAAAFGGMMLPALIYFFIVGRGAGASGWGIPMATDIAFSLAVLSTLGKRVPFGIRLFLTTFAIADDLGAILVIAIFYTPQIYLWYLAGAAGVCCILFLLNRLNILTPMAYALVGVVLWFMIANSGLHATITGVLVAMFVPAKGKLNTDFFLHIVRHHLGDIRCENGVCGYTIMENRQHLEAVHGIYQACHLIETPLQNMEHAMEHWIAYLILPLFALANAGIVLGNLDIGSALMDPVTLGVTFGLFLGKPVGIILFTWLATKLLRVELLDGVTWPMVFGAGFLGGIGFTMSLFISALSFSQPILQEYAKIGIIMGSVLGGTSGYLLLWWVGKGQRGSKPE